MDGDNQAGFDHVIIGAGSAGCVLANRLSEDPTVRVLLLEAGPADSKTEIHVPAAYTKLFKSAYDWAYQTEPEPGLDNRSIFVPRGKTLGGSSSINAQMYLRGHPADFDSWAAQTDAAWSYADVLPYFVRCEGNQGTASAFHGTAGPLTVADPRDPHPLTRAFVQAAIQTGIAPNQDHNGAEQDGVGLVQVTQRRGARCSAADAYLRPARRRSNLQVLTGAQATRVVFEGQRATGVEYALGQQRRVARARREVILCGGSINSPQLLLLSGIGPAEQLREMGIEVRADLPGVGGNLQDHLVSGILVRIRRPISLLSAESPTNLARYIAFRKGPLTSNLAEAAAFVRSRPGLLAPDLELIFVPALYQHEGLRPPTEHGFTIGSIVLQPRSVGRVSLASADPFAAPRIEARYLSDADGQDLALMLHGLRLARKIAAAEALAPFAADEIEPGVAAVDDAALAASVRRVAHTLYHPVGTCKMGSTNDELAVVDPELRVRGFDGLRVVDASIMPSIIRGHTNAATMMIAERAADFLRAPSASSSRL